MGGTVQTVQTTGGDSRRSRSLLHIPLLLDAHEFVVELLSGGTFLLQRLFHVP